MVLSFAASEVNHEKPKNKWYFFLRRVSTCTRHFCLNWGICIVGYCWFISTLGHISYVVLFVGLLLSLDSYKGDDGEKMTSEKK